jgi:hypothetical protein
VDSYPASDHLCGLFIYLLYYVAVLPQDGECPKMAASKPVVDTAGTWYLAVRKGGVYVAVEVVCGSCTVLAPDG